MITIVDYGMGNLGSVRSMFARIGAESRIVSAPEGLEDAEKLVLPGVGAFDHAMTNLDERGLIPALNRCVLEREVPVLGICLGMQLMTDGSEEGALPGLGWIPGKAIRFHLPPEHAENLRLPHMGWNTLLRTQASWLLGEEQPHERYYFVHSFHVECRESSDVLAQANYGVPFTAALGRGHIQATQFHPEKSHRFGMDLLKRFSEGPHATS